MAQTAKSIVLSKFEAGDRPTDQDFLNLFDSILFLNNVGSHNNGLSTANTSLEGNFIIGNNLSVLGTGILSLAGSVSIGNTNESVSSKLHVYNDHASNPVMFVSGSSTNIMFSGISGDPTSSISLQDNYASSAVARFGTHTGKAFISLLDNEVVSISASNAGYVSSFSGSIGIGTESPAYTLDLGENSSTIRLVSENNGTAIRVGAGGNSNDVTLLRIDGASTNANGTSDSAEFGFSLKYMGSRAGNENSFSIFSDNQTSTAVEALTILQDGKVGIGVASPTTHLHVENADDTQALFKSTDAGPTYIRIDTSAADADTAAAVLYMENGGIRGASGYNPSSDTMVLTYATGTNTVSGININSDGDIGIGTQSPSQKLHLLNSTDDTNLLVESSKTDGRAQIRFKNDEQEFVAGTSTGDNFIVFDATNTTTPFLIEPGTPNHTLYVDSNGRIGIGTTNPVQKLVIVDGNIQLSNNYGIGRSIGDASEEYIIYPYGTGMSTSFSNITAQGTLLAEGMSLQSDAIINFVETDNNTLVGNMDLNNKVFDWDGKINAQFLYGDGSNITNVAATAITALIANDADNRIITAEGDSTLNAEANFTFSATNNLRLSGSFAIGQGTAGLFTPDAPLHIKHTGDSLGTQDFIHLSMGSGTTEGNISIKFSDNGDVANQNFRITYGEGNNALKFHSDSVNNILYLEDGGNVGIGTNSPDSKLEVLGDIAVRNAADNTNVVLIKNSDNFLSDADIIFHNNGALAGADGLHMFTGTDGSNEKFAVYNGGLGANNATEILTVSTGSVGSGLAILGNKENNHPAQIMFTANTFNNSGSDDIARIKHSSVNSQGSFYEGSNKDFLVFEKIDTGTSVDGGILFTNTSTGATDKTEKVSMAIQGDGKVGIGITTPSNLLHVKETTNDAKIRIQTDKTNGRAQVLLQNDARQYNVGISATNDNFIVFDDTESTTPFLIESATPSNTLVVDSNGRVGIGTANPDEKLSVTGGNIELTSEGKIGFNVSDDIGSYTVIQDDGTTATASDQVAQYGLSRPGTAIFDPVVLSGYYGLEFATNGLKRVRINQDGKVGIGTDSPVELLEVQGSVDNDDIAILIQNTSDDNNASTPPRAAIRFEAASNNAYFRCFGAPDDAASGHQIDIGSTAGSSFFTFTPDNNTTLKVASDHITMFGTNNSFTQGGGIVFKSEHDATGPATIPTSEFSSDSDVTTHLIQFSQATNSTDAGLIAHQSRGTTDTNTGILHLCPSDDKIFGDYVFIHGYNEALGIKIHTSGQIQITSDTATSGTGVANSLILGTSDGTDRDTLAIQSENGTTSIGMENTSYTHYRTEASHGHYFAQGIVVDNQLTTGTLSGVAGIESYDTDLFLFDHAGKSYIQLKDTEIDMYADSVQVLDIGKGSTGISISGDGTHTRALPIALSAANVTTRLQVKGTHGSSGDAGLSLLDVVGTSQGDAVIHFGQNSNAGGFIYYRGDGTSDSTFDGLTGSDTIFFGSNDNTVAGVQPVMSYKYNNQNVSFHGRVNIGIAGASHSAPESHPAFGGVTMDLDVHPGNIGAKVYYLEPDENSDGQSFRILLGAFGGSTANRIGFQGSQNGTSAANARYITHNASGNAFTGQHPCKPFRSITNYVDKIGHIVVSKGTIANYPENWWDDETNSFDSSYLDKVTINESLPVIELSNQPNDKKVYGVIANVDDPNTTDRDDTNQTGGFNSYIADRIDDRISVNSVGEGAIMVCNINGNLENGDYITTSAIEGLGMKQDDDLLHNYTVAKIVQDCNFDSGTTDVTYNGVTYKTKLVGCTYHCG